MSAAPSSTRAETRPAPLQPEDGAKFHARIAETADGEFQAICFARLARGATVDEEFPQYHLSQTRTGARSWVHQLAAARGFSRIVWESEP